MDGSKMWMERELVDNLLLFLLLLLLLDWEMEE